jgi:hypothetical protein
MTSHAPQRHSIETKLAISIKLTGRKLSSATKSKMVDREKHKRSQVRKLVSHLNQFHPIEFMKINGRINYLICPLCQEILRRK